MAIQFKRANVDSRGILALAVLLFRLAVFCLRRARAGLGLIGLMLLSAPAAAIPPNTPITNTAAVSYAVQGNAYSVSGSHTVTTDGASGNSAPFGVELSANLAPENAPGAVIGSVTIRDPDPGDAHTFTVSDARFVVTNGELRLADGVSLDFEDGANVPVTVTVTDAAGATYSQTLNITVGDVNEAPTDIDLDSLEVEANTPGAVVGNLLATDPDTGDTLTWVLDDARFEVVGGQLKLRDNESLPLGEAVTLTATVTDAAGLEYTETFVLRTVPPGAGGPATTLDALVHRPLDPAASALTFTGSTCRTSGGPVAQGAPIDVRGDTVVAGAALLQTGFAKSGDALFVRVRDVDANLDAAVSEQIDVLLQTPAGDTETLIATENGPNTGEFVAYIQTVRAAAAPESCQLETDAGTQVTISYTDANDPLDVAQTSVRIDPLARVFDSASGRLIDGATIRLLDASGAPAAVFADDGVTPSVPVQISGPATGGAGAGEFRFPHVPAGSYQLDVTPPNRFRFPSATSDVALQALPDGPWALSQASRGDLFDLPDGPLLHVDIPLDVVPVAPSASQLALYGASAGGAGLPVVPSACFDGAAFVTSPRPAPLGQAPLLPPVDVPVASRSRFARGDVVFIRVTDADQDADPFAADTVEALVTVPGGDVERIQLGETGASTGVFVGYVQTSAAATSSPNNCRLEAAPNSALAVTYVDAGDSADTSVAEALLDPGFTVFSSSDGRSVDGATITLIDVASGLPATVLSTDGVSAFPATVVSGGTASDAAGRTFDFAPGTFLFPRLAPGTYALQVQAPLAYNFPTQLDDAALQALPGGPFLLSDASRGAPFTVVDEQPFAFDVPLDPVSVDVFVTKQASKEAVAVGEFVQYQVNVENGDALAGIAQATVVDSLPPGFRYMSGSLQINQQRAGDPQIAPDGRVLHIALGDLLPGETAEVRYVVEVASGARAGVARNSATLTGIGVGSANTAFADVVVRDELMRSVAVILGQVLQVQDESCEQPEPLPSSRVWLEDGSYAVTDAQGKFHFADVTPGTHVLKLDTGSIPGSMEPAFCESHTQFAGAAATQFVDLRGGTIWRSNFYVKPRPAITSDVVTRLDVTAEPDAGLVTYTYRIVTGEVGLQRVRATVMLDDKLTYQAGSSRLNGAALDDPGDLDNALTFRLPDTEEAAELTLQFTAQMRESVLRHPDLQVVNAPLDTRAVLMFRTRAGRHRTDVSDARLSLIWPASLTTLVDTTDDFPGQNNARALQEARDKNAHHLPGRAPAPAPQTSDVVVVGGVHEPSLGANRARSKTSRLQVSVPLEAAAREPYLLPELDRGDGPDFDAEWLEANSAARGIVWPPENYNPVIPAVPVAVLHESGLKPQLLVDGELVNPLSFDGTITHHKLGLTLSVWSGVPISEQDSVLDARLLDTDGNTRSSSTQKVHYSSGAAGAELLRDKSWLVADGLNAPMLAVRLYDRAGYPVRAGSTGEFSVTAPFAPLNKTRHLENQSNEFDVNRYRVLRDGIAYIQLEPTTQTGEVSVHFQFDQVRSETLRARMVPGARDWILVGLVEGSWQKNDLGGRLREAEEDGQLDDTLHDGRVAFYAKGMVRGDWLLTAAYDTDKAFERELRRQIDPNQFYTLYGDGSSQLFDAQSQRKLYLKLERERFSSLFGDFDTGFSRSELSRYERRLNGLNVGYFGEKVEVQAFASETDQAFIRDELRGDGTSGVYRLRRSQVVRNSESVRIVTRDRFRPEIVVEDVALTRFQDYTIDYDRGTLIFRQPVFGQDEAFNPVFIEVEYEVAGPQASDEWVAGTRMAYRLDDQDSEVALAWVDDNTAGQGGTLLGLDATWQFDPKRTVTAEFATTDTEQAARASAYLLQLEHAGAKMAGRIYLRELEDDFGLGHQASVEQGTRKAGIEGEYRSDTATLLSAQMFHQELLSSGDERLIVNAQAEHTRWGTQWLAGLRGVREDTSLSEQQSAQLRLGASRPFLNNRIVLRADAELGLASDDVADYPTRAVLGAEYRLPRNVRLFAEQELTWSDLRDTQDSRLGVRGRPWNGADIGTTLQRQNGEMGERLFATTGLLQQIRLSEAWMLDFGADRVQTLSRRDALPGTEQVTFNPVVPPASGSVNEDFSAFFAGAAYRQAAWNINTRLELHQGDLSDKWNLLLGANRQLAEGRVISSSLAALNEKLHDGGINDRVDLRLGLAWRPDANPWTFLNRTDLVFSERANGTFDSRARKWVNNFAANFRPNERHQVSVQLGAKYVVEEIDSQEFDSLTYLLGGEYRFNVTSRIDLGAHASMLGSGNAGTSERSYGVAVGFQAVRDAWVSLGYNFEGFEDEDFVGADYTARGVYLKLRLKFDEALLKRFLEPGGERSGASWARAAGRAD